MEKEKSLDVLFLVMILVGSLILSFSIQQSFQSPEIKITSSTILLQNGTSINLQGDDFITEPIGNGLCVGHSASQLSFYGCDLNEPAEVLRR